MISMPCHATSPPTPSTISAITLHNTAFFIPFNTYPMPLQLQLQLQPLPMSNIFPPRNQMIDRIGNEEEERKQSQ